MGSVESRIRAIEKALEPLLRPPTLSVPEAHSLIVSAICGSEAAQEALADFKARGTDAYELLGAALRREQFQW